MFSVYSYYSSNTGFKEIYNSKNYFWPIFSIKNYKQDNQGWFNYSKKKRRKKNRISSLEDEININTIQNI